MVQLGFERHPTRLLAPGCLLSRCGPNHWTGLRKETALVFISVHDLV